MKISADFTPSVTVYDSNPGYGLDDTPDAGGTSSIVDQIESKVRSLYGSSSYSYYTVDFLSVGSTSSAYKGYLDASTRYTYYDEDLPDVVFVPNTTLSSSNSTETESFEFTVKIYNSSNKLHGTYDGIMTFNIKQGESSSSGDIAYTAGLGEDVYLDLDDFEDFWTDKYSKGALDYVTFGSVSGGTVYNSSNKSVGSTKYYVDPSSSQSGLDGVYFSPNSTTSKKATTVRIPFSAYGSTTASGKTSTTPRNGTIVITYLSAAAAKITYSTNASGTVSLAAQDFIDAYKAATNTSSTPSNLTIQFQGVPTNGTLTYNDSSKSSSKDVKLTSSNIMNYKFTTKTTGSNQLGDVTYSVSGAKTDTITYIGYIGTTATFTGEVTFNAAAAVPTNVSVILPTCYTTAGVPLAMTSFTSAHTAMANASYVMLGTPRTGKLVNTTGANAAGTAVSVMLLGGVTYIPSTTTAATSDSFTFTAYDASNNKVASGTVTVTVVLPASVINPNAITSVAQLTDVPTNSTADWYRDKLTYLINRGMISGKGNGKFGPEDEVEYSEALKFIMNAAGIVCEESTTGNWAQNYKNTAVQYGWISSSVDLVSHISRTAMAELAAKVLNVPSTSAASPFADTSNASVVALYNATFTVNGVTGRIIQGSNDLNGRLCFNPDKALTRDEMVCLVYNMYQYSGK